MLSPTSGGSVSPVDPPATQQTSLPGVVDSIEHAYPRARAIHAASRIKPLLLRFCMRDRGGQPYCRVAGSLRRRQAEVHDVDVVLCVSTVPDDTMAPETSPLGRLRLIIEKRADAVYSWGPDRARLVFDGVPFEDLEADRFDFHGLPLLRCRRLRRERICHPGPSSAVALLRRVDVVPSKDRFSHSAGIDSDPNRLPVRVRGPRHTCNHHGPRASPGSVRM